MRFAIALAAGIQACAGSLAAPEACTCPRVALDVGGPSHTLVSCAKLYDPGEERREVLGLNDLECSAFEIPDEDVPKEPGDESL